MVPNVIHFLVSFQSKTNEDLKVRIEPENKQGDFTNNFD